MSAGPHLPLTLLCVLALAGACDQGEADANDGETTSAPGPCDGDHGGMDYSAGMSVESDKGMFRVTLADASPAPPARFLNDWTLQFEMLGSEDFADAELDIDPQMPQHMHGSASAAEIAAPNGNEVQVTAINLHMAGYWEVNVELEAADGSWADEAMFAFCVE